jgi:uncharacterized protein (TIGR02145 family)
MNTQKKHIIFIAGFYLLLVVTNCKKNKEDNNLPKITTSAVDNIGDKYATAHASVVSEGTSDVIGVGICWSTSHNPTVNDNKYAIPTKVIGDFEGPLTGLTANTKYYVRSYAVYGQIAYGNEVSFTTTVPLPELTTQPITNITLTSATSGGVVTNNQGLDITAKGICWSTNLIPTIADNKTSNGNGTSSFLSSITGLTPNASYYVRAYATTSIGTAYGNTLGLVFDIDGNWYTTVTIGTQLWMLQNLKVTHYQNGDAIPNVTDNTWDNYTTGIYCNYNNKDSLASIYGRLYNWYAAMDSRNICPTGWHVPSINDFNTLKTYLGGTTVVAGKLKEAGTSHWASPNTDASNSSGFTALPGGERGSDKFYDVHNTGILWTSTATSNVWTPTGISNDGAIYIGLYYNTNSFQSDGAVKVAGFSIRCLHD